MSPDGDGEVKLGFLTHGLQRGFALASECWGAIEGYTIGECPALLCISNLSAYFYEEGTVEGKQRGKK